MSVLTCEICQAIGGLVVQANSYDLGEPAHLNNLTRVNTVCIDIKQSKMISVAKAKCTCMLLEDVRLQCLCYVRLEVQQAYFTLTRLI